jgi:sigma-54 dependent transcriptional regulator, acetoin dehydrogenase operon transcriptional activator AcoR
MRMPPSTRSATRPGAAHRHGTDAVRALPASLMLADPEHFEAIVQSHERCAALGVSRIDAPDYAGVGRADLNLALQRNRRLHEHAAPVMALLHDQIARTESMVLLTDSVGTIIHAVGDDDFLGRADKVALRPGANWSEGAKGTNAVGTALVVETPTLVHADEHYLHANQFLTCSAAPILDPRGNMLGVLDVSGDSRSYHQHTLALVRMSARMIENRWLTEDMGHALRLHFHARPEFIGTFMEGIVAVSEEGRILGANRSAMELLGMSGAALRMQNLGTLFGTSVGALVEHCRSRLATPATLTSPTGRPFSAFARCNWPVWLTPPAQPNPVTPLTGAEAAAGPHDADSRSAEQSVLRATPHATPAAAPHAAPHAAAPAAIPAAPAGQALAQLRTGDLAVDAVVDKIRRVLDRDIPILVLGETGTGKELLARAIHADSARCNKPFVAVNCAAIPEHQIEAELFGCEAGAFTGARRKGEPGKIIQAHGGTLFLDDIGELPLPVQAQLLRVLQERQFTPVGSSRVVPVDVAIICATPRNLREMLDRQTFREDLYYRLNGLAVRLPPLRERSDLMTLVRRTLERQGGGNPHHLAPDVARLFESYAWPGNVRQLFHLLRTACVMAGAEVAITRGHLPDDFLEEAQAAAARTRATEAASETKPAWPVAAAAPSSTPSSTPSAATAAQAGHRTLDDVERETIQRTLDELKGNISEASKRLGISRNTIYRKLRWRTSERGESSSGAP